MTAGEWIYRFGHVQVEPGAHRITRDGEELRLEPKAFAVLVALLEQSGKALERDDLLDRVWGHRHVTPGVLNRVVAQLRKALGDDAEHPLYIQTLHSLGYRFVGEVTRIPAQASPDEQAALAATQLLTPSVHEEPTQPERATADQAKAAHVPMPRWRLAAIGITCIAVLGWYYLKQSPPRPATASVAVMSFTSLSSDPDDGYFAEGLAVEIRDALSDVQGMTVAAQLSSAPRDRSEADIKALGDLLGVATVLDASVRREGELVRINASLADTATGYTLWSETYDRPITDVFSIQTEIAEEVVKSLMGVLPDGNESLAKRLTPTNNAAAFDAYLMGLHLLGSTVADSDASKAIVYFGKALAQDSKFARAQLGICRTELWRFEYVRDADSFERARDACENARGMDPESGDVNLALGDLHRVQGETDKAMAHYTKAKASPALRAGAQVGMARLFAAQGRQDLALKHFQQALALRPGDASVHAQVGYYHYLTGNVSGAIDSYRKATQLRPRDADAMSTLGGLYMLAGNTDTARKVLQESIRIKPTSAGLSNYAEIRFDDGDYAAATSLLRKAVELDSRDFQIWGTLGDALLADPGTALQSREPYRRAVKLAEQYIAMQPDDAVTLAALGWYLSGLGEHTRARDLAARSEALDTDRGEVALLNAQTMTALGEKQEALGRIQAARKAGISESRIQDNVFLKDALGMPPAASGNRKPGNQDIRSMD